jgi:osomolarity two-component system, sensor histidine kinase SLN1
VRSIVKLLGGRLGYSSVKNSGSTFWVELPFGVGEEVVRTTNPTVGDTLEPAPSDGGPQHVPTNANELFLGSSRDPEMTLGEGSSSPPILRLPHRTFAVDPAPTSSTHLSSGSSLSNSNPMTLFDRAFSASSSQKDLDETPVGLSVLIVDDDEVTRRMMSRLLSRFGCKTAVAENGRIALEMILGSDWVYNDENGFTRTNPDESDSMPIQSEPFYNVVFMDNQMPLMSGIKAVKQLRRVGRADYVVGLTGNALLPGENSLVKTETYIQ